MIKRALLVGINAYPGAELRGCLNDVKQIHDLLTGTYGFDEKEIRILRDQEATFKGIEAGLAWLAEGGRGGGASTHESSSACAEARGSFASTGRDDGR